MRNHITYFAFLGFAWFLTNLLASQPVMAQETTDDVKAINDAFYEAFSQRDMAKMGQVWSHEPYIRNINPNGKEILSGWEAVSAHWLSVFERFNPITITMENADIRLGPQVAWVVGQETFQATMEGDKQMTLKVLATNVFEKVNGQWLLVHHHGSAVPE